jgi:hypothetical protein
MKVKNYEIKIQSSNQAKEKMTEEFNFFKETHDTGLQFACYRKSG